MSLSSNYTLVNIIRKNSSFYLDGQKRSENVLEKMLEVDRILFLPEGVKQYAYIDEPLPIGFGQTCSQPSMVAFILDKLDIKPGNKILEIGSGCGYAAAIASKICCNDGKVWAIEIIPDLVRMMQQNIRDNYSNITIINGDGSTGLQNEAPFDRIFVSAGVCWKTFNSEILLKQLTKNGILIYPEAIGSLFKVIKTNDGNKEVEYSGVCFVPLKGKNS